MFDDIIPVIHITFQIPKIIGTEVFLKYSYQDTRSIWDPYKKNINKFRFCDSEIERYSLQLPFITAEFCDRILIKKIKNGIGVISFSHENCSETGITGKNIMSYVSLQTSLNQSVIQAVFQLDFKIRIKEDSHLILGKLFEGWGILLKKYLTR